ncbi:hypothetical protein BD833_10233 [Blastococcus xanthinilyticus]|uniref:Uncharacterized protein n=1 Tax=Blastococcus xanthinilyticus TaxID=1564164 RepID=A0A5S5D0K7_9ACTN|nr:hypothetical protein BD833_10233 [Blastococcus xanthinilyticus]
MVSAWILVTVSALLALPLGYGAVRLSRGPKAARR